MEKTTEETPEKVILEPSDNPEVAAIIEQHEIIQEPVIVDPDPDQDEPEQRIHPEDAKLIKEILPGLTKQANEPKGFDFLTLAIFGSLIALAILLYIKYGNLDDGSAGN